MQQQLNQRCHKNHTVEPIEYAAMTRKNLAVIFNAALSLDDGERLITDLTEHSTQNTGCHTQRHRQRQIGKRTDCNAPGWLSGGILRHRAP